MPKVGVAVSNHEMSRSVTACIACWGDHVRYISGQSWLSGPSMFCLLRRACCGIECEYRELWSV